MTSLSTNIKLLLTGADETTMTFQEWRTAMNGMGNNSNMELIDTAIGELTKACAKKADGFVFNPETGVLQLTCEGEALEGDSTSTTIDLSRFYTKAEVDTLLDEAQLTSEKIADALGYTPAKEADVEAVRVKDSVVSETSPWSSQRIVNTLCQEVTASGNPVACTPVKDSQLDIKVSWESTQAGNGTPSPTNIRPIMGRNQVALTVNGEAHTLTLPHVVYGGSVDVATGEVTEEYALFKSGDARLYTTSTPSTASNWVSAYYVWGAIAGKEAQEIKFCNALPVKKWDYITAKESIDEPCCWYATSSWGIAMPRAQLSLADDASQQEILNAIQSYADELGFEIAYTLATPTHYQVTGIGEVTALDGANTISTDADHVIVTWREAARADVKDVRVNGTSILAKGVANVPVASKTALGVVGIDNYSIGVTDTNRLFLYGARNGDVNARASNIAIDPIGLDYAVKAAMCDGKGAAWTAAEQAAARDRMGIDDFAEIVATEPTAQQILSIMQQEMALLNQLVENGMGNKGSLNGFSFSRGDDGELIISYVNPDDETDVAMSTFATKATANLIAQELAAINESLHTIVGAEQTTTNTEG